ncbi:MAG: hydroxyacid dehydrogenase [Lachnospiraceae bacterium]|nr:hydroxyacid dehydrogenase [Lachnospiraceae bacterium]
MDRRLFLCETRQNLLNAYTDEQRAGSLMLTNKEFLAGPPLPKTEAVFSSWGMPALTEEQIAEKLPNLRYVFYAAGTVQAFARPFLAKGVRVFSAWAANAVPVAEFTLAEILLANKGFFQLDRRYRTEGFRNAAAYADHFEGNYHNKVGLLGAGMVGKKVIENLKPYDIAIDVFDPFLPDETAEALGVRKTSLEDIFENCPIISNHLANNKETVGMLDYRLFSLMSPYAVFINTGRNAQVVVPDLIRAMKEEPGRTALLDVTDPEEPLPAGHPLWSVPNVVITPHRAGSQRKEILRMGAYMMDEYRRVTEGRAPLYEVSMDMLRTMA